MLSDIKLDADIITISDQNGKDKIKKLDIKTENLVLDDAIILGLKGINTKELQVEKDVRVGSIEIDGDKRKINVSFPSPISAIGSKVTGPSAESSAILGVKLAPLPAQKPPGSGTKPDHFQPKTYDLVEEILNLREYVKALYENAKLPIPPKLNE